jgi:hypothetical protein
VHNLFGVMHQTGERVVAAGVNGLLQGIKSQVRPHRGEPSPVAMRRPDSLAP